MRTLAIGLVTQKPPQRFPPPAALDWPGDGRTSVQDRSSGPAFLPARRGRPCPPPLHARPRTGWRGGEGDPKDEIALRRAPRASLARRIDAPPGFGRAPDGDGRRARPLAPRRSRAAVPARRRAPRRGGDAAPVHGAGSQPARVPGADTLPRRARRARADHRPLCARPAGPVVPAQAALALRLPAAPDELRELRHGRRRSDRVFGGCRRRGLCWVRKGGARPVPGRNRRDRGPARSPAEAREVGLSERSLRDALAVITNAYEYYGNFRLRTLRSA